MGIQDPHVALDPFQYQTSGDWGLRCISEFNVSDAVAYHPITSERYLVDARDSKKEHDFIFIDGAHDTGHKVADALLAADVLAPTGVICFHDSFFSSTAIAIRYLIKERGFELIDVPVESKLKRRLRGVKHLRRLGAFHAFHVAPKVNFSVSILRRRQANVPAK